MAKTGKNIYKRKDGRWEGRCIIAYSNTGKAKYKYVYAKTYSEVKTKLFNAQVELQKSEAENKSCDENNYEFWLNEWLKNKKKQVKESTYIRYRNTINNHISSELGQHKLSEITTNIIDEFISQKLICGKLDNSGGVSPKTASDMLVIIKETFKFAQSKGVTTICDFEDISVKKSSREMRVLTSSEEQRLLSVLFNEIDKYKLGVFICLFTGIRIGELCALQWKNVSLIDKTLKVEQTMQRLQNDDLNSTTKTKVVITEPKTPSALRVIPLPDFIIKTLEPFADLPNSYILSDERKVYTEPRTMQNKFKCYLTDGEIKDANFHALRHTFATRCIEVGFDVKTLSELLGHSSVKITLDRYVHSSLQLKRSNMEKLQLNVI